MGPTTERNADASDSISPSQRRQITEVLIEDGHLRTKPSGHHSADRGILYFAKGDTFIKEAELSARQVTRVMPEYPISIVADREPDAECFDEVLIDTSEFSKRNKPQAMRRTPYERTIYLDTDTYVQEPIDDLFDLLDEFDLALRRNKGVCHIPETDETDPNADVPEGFPEFNSGVFPYRKTSAVRDLLREWERLCLPDHTADQRSLRPALYNSSVRFTCLPNRYNCMYRNDNIVNKSVKVFHGPLVNRESNRIDLREAVEKLNRSVDCRLYYVYGNTLFVNPSPTDLLKPWLRIAHLWDIFRDHGIRMAAGAALRKVSDSFKNRLNGPDSATATRSAIIDSSVAVENAKQDGEAD